MPNGRPRLVNQKLLNQMVALRRQGFSHREIADRIGRSERTARRYTKGVTPQLKISTQPDPVNVLSACAGSIIRSRKQLGLDTRETDLVIKTLRRKLARLDPLIIDWLAKDPEGRREFLREFLRDVKPHISDMREFRRIEAEIGPA